MDKNDFRYLYKVNSPEELKRLRKEELRPYCDDLRRFIIESLSENPGHLASSLGCVELATAIHYVFNTPYDKVVWDVGHQAYAHKIITGRRDLFATNRKFKGISGFPKMSESQYDSFGGGHSSVSISAALGIAEAARLKGEDRRVVAIIGDGAMTGGLAFEGFNNAGASNADLLVILNDNDMSIDANVGALREYLLGMTTSSRYNRIKNRAWELLGNTMIRRFLKRLGNAIKHGILHNSNLFEALKFRYFGPIEGHDVVALSKVLADLKNIKGPKLLHVITTKGKGYAPAERNQSVWHAPGRFNFETGERVKGATNLPSRYQDVFGETLLELAKNDDRIVGITPAMPTGSSLDIMMKVYPDRCFDVGIAEGHAVTFSAGLAAEGMIPFCAIYSSFMQRAYDNLIHDVALQNLGVVFCLDRAGLVGEDGSTHHGVFDIAYLRPIPNVVIASPMNENELRSMLYTASMEGRPFVVRYPRGCGEGVEIKPFERIDVGSGRKLRDGDDIAVLSFGPLGNAVALAIDGIDNLSVAHYDMRFAKPLDEALLSEIGAKFKRVLTVEDGVVFGGFGSGVVEFMERGGFACHVSVVGIGDDFVHHGTVKELHRLCGLDVESIKDKILSFV